MKEKIAFLGLGRMGHAMATNLVKSGHDVTVYNRSIEKAESFRQLGAQVAATPAEAVREATVVFTMVTDDKALRELTTGPEGILTTLPQGAVHASCSTVAPETNEELAQRHREHGSMLVATPVFGKPDAAAAAKLWVALSGPTEACQRVQPLLPAFSQGTYEFGEQVSAANVVKLCGNYMLGAAIQAMSEAFTLAEKSGVDRQQVYQMFTSTIFNSPVYINYGRMIAPENYTPVGATPAIIGKDLNLVMDQAEKTGVPMPVASLVRDNLRTMTERGITEEDWTVFARLVSEGAGIQR